VKEELTKKEWLATTPQKEPTPHQTQRKNQLIRAQRRRVEKKKLRKKTSFRVGESVLQSTCDSRIFPSKETKEMGMDWRWAK